MSGIVAQAPTPTLAMRAVPLRRDAPRVGCHMRPAEPPTHGGLSSSKGKARYCASDIARAGLAPWRAFGTIDSTRASRTASPWSDEAARLDVRVRPLGMNREVD